MTATNGMTKVNDCTADTKIMLNTGGKGVAGGQSLWVINVSATNMILDLGGDDGLMVDTIDPSQITVNGQQAGSGNVYLVLPDGQTVTLDVQAGGSDYYTFSLSATKYLSHFEVFVDQPDPTGTHVWTFADAAGHAWWRLRSDAPGDAVNEFISSDLAHFLNDSVGYAPTNTATVNLIFPNAPGELRDPESDIYFSVYRKYDIGFSSLIAGLHATKTLKETPGEYGIYTFNCVDAVIRVGNAAGKPLRDDKGPKSYSNPENFGKGLPPSD